MKKVVIVGAGPTGLFCAYQLLQSGYSVDLYDQSGGIGKKFLIAGHGGLNLTHSEDHERFVRRYYENEERFDHLLTGFSPVDLRQWFSQLGIETFVGTSGRIFPKNHTAGEIIKRWGDALKESAHFSLHLKHRLINFKNSECIFESHGQTLFKKFDFLILALGGASYSQTGSDGKWMQHFEYSGITCVPFRAMNCGFDVNWSTYFRQHIDYSPIKNIRVHIDDTFTTGEIMLTPHGIEGGAIYALSYQIGKILEECGDALVTIDLKPSLTSEQIREKLEKRRGRDSLGNTLRKHLKFSSAMLTLLYECSDRSRLSDPNYLIEQVKSLTVHFIRPRPMEEAISTAGGVAFSALSDDLSLKEMDCVFIAGEMLDFTAPTGGYLLQGCFSTGQKVIQSILSR